MNPPIVITNNSFQVAWVNAARRLKDNGWDLWNLVVHITDPTNYDNKLNAIVTDFSDENCLIRPKGVAYTIFPHKLYNRVHSADKVYSEYLDKIYPWTRTRDHSGWGTYFHRMINYYDDRRTNQLSNIINAINDRDRISRAAYTIVIEKPGGETTRPLGAPCLNYIAVQVEPNVTSKTISLLCIYRNHDFLKRAYGNYWGLCNLLCFIAAETHSSPGTLTCISSHAYVDEKRASLRNFLEVL